MTPARGRRRHLRIVPTPYRLPDALDTFEDARRLYHEDIPEMSAAAAWEEAQEVRRALAALAAVGDRFLTLPPYTRISAAAWCRQRLALFAERAS